MSDQEGNQNAGFLMTGLIYSKNLSKSLLQTKKSDDVETWHVNWSPVITH